MLLPVLSFFILGAIVGSFLNVVILRFKTGRSIVRGRSVCFSCGKKLSPHELVPILSYLVLRGRCSACKSHIAPQYALVEFVTGITFAYLFFQFGLSLTFLLYAAMASYLIIMFVYDLRHKIIPDTWSYTFAALALGALFLQYGAHIFTVGMYDFLAGFILFLFFWFFWFVSGGRWMGLGDAKLALGVGWLLGLSAGIFAIVVAFWTGALISLSVLAMTRLHVARGHLTMKSEIPFAPFIIFGTVLAFVSGWNFIDVLNLLG